MQSIKDYSNSIFQILQRIFLAQMEIINNMEHYSNSIYLIPHF